MAPKEGKEVPVTIVSGFLGAGKSTLVRRILTEEHGLRVLVVENEIGEEVGIENVLVTEGVDKEVVADFIEMPNGCICCSVKDELTDALSKVVRSGKGFDLVVIETSGLADPGPVASLFWVDEDLDLGLKLDGIICLVDALNAKKHLGDSIFVKQLALADLVLINKVDLVDDLLLDSLESELQKIVPTARRKRTSMSKCDLREALSLNTLRENSLPLAFLSSRDIQDHRHSEGVGAVTVKFASNCSFDERMLERQLGLLIWEQPAGEIWRMKALVSIGQRQERWLYQGVHDLFEGNVSGNWGDEHPRSSFIFIGKHVNRSGLEKHLSAAFIQPDQ
eukprot:Plantae.Rhodophyta-Purpureofilum_apyrenoidigerum.ctg13728.p1 GENE.Plantae.Rhodophyta-Purpureofilum_apyrenoidigerum.ctg13728~~Plantae.Rhodophyta-Purpureofilum_apyrenoidigerum.ctg13728.p1  ORF type:complete len:335 (+),score=70.60 Plantae.Rhodophyta-Purpureofilum_apyrenoidigerum.ctg13728:161-1165(+)